MRKKRKKSRTTASSGRKLEFAVERDGTIQPFSREDLVSYLDSRIPYLSSEQLQEQKINIFLDSFGKIKKLLSFHTLFVLGDKILKEEGGALYCVFSDSVRIKIINSPIPGDFISNIQYLRQCNIQEGYPVSEFEIQHHKKTIARYGILTVGPQKLSVYTGAQGKVVPLGTGEEKILSGDPDILLSALKEEHYRNKKYISFLEKPWGMFWIKDAAGMDISRFAKKVQDYSFTTFEDGFVCPPAEVIGDIVLFCKEG